MTLNSKRGCSIWSWNCKLIRLLSSPTSSSIVAWALQKQIRATGHHHHHHHHHHHRHLFWKIVHSFHAMLGFKHLPIWGLSTHPWIPSIQDVNQTLPCLHPHTLCKSSYSSFYISPLPPPSFYRPIPNHSISYAPDATPHHIHHTLHTQKTVQIHTVQPILQRHPAHPSHYHPFHPLQTLQFCMSIYCQQLII